VRTGAASEGVGLYTAYSTQHTSIYSAKHTDRNEIHMTIFQYIPHITNVIVIGCVVLEEKHENGWTDGHDLLILC